MALTNPYTSIGGAFQNNFGNEAGVATGGLLDTADWTPAQLDQGTKDIIAQQAAQGGKSQEQIAAEQLYGTSGTMAPAMGGAVGQSEMALGGPGDSTALTAALNDRANKLYGSQYAQLQSGARAAAPLRQGNLMAQGASALQQEQNINDQLNRYQIAVTLQKEALRNQFIGNLFGGIGSAAGGYMGRRAMRNSGNGPTENTEPNKYSGDPNSPDFMGPPTPFASEGGQNIRGAYAGPDSGVGPLGYGYPGQDGNGYYGEPWMNSGGGSGLGRSYQGLG